MNKGLIKNSEITLSPLTAKMLPEAVELMLLSDHYAEMVTRNGVDDARKTLTQLYSCLEPKSRVELVINHIQHGLIGLQDCYLFPEKGEAETGSWITEEHRGHGYGTASRALALDYIFSIEGIRLAISEVILPNVASERVSQKLGYRIMQDNKIQVRGQAAIARQYGITLEEWFYNRERFLL